MKGSLYQQEMHAGGDRRWGVGAVENQPMSPPQGLSRPRCAETVLTPSSKGPRIAVFPLSHPLCGTPGVVSVYWHQKHTPPQRYQALVATPLLRQQPVFPSVKVRQVQMHRALRPPSLSDVGSIYGSSQKLESKRFTIPKLTVAKYICVCVYIHIYIYVYSRNSPQQRMHQPSLLTAERELSLKRVLFGTSMTKMAWVSL